MRELSDVQGRKSLWRSFLPVAFLCLVLSSARAQNSNVALAGADTSEHKAESRPHFFGDWDGERERLHKKGLDLDLLYVSDSLWNIRSAKQERLAVWDRVRGTLDFDFGHLTNIGGLKLHITAVYQGGGNLGQYLGTLTGPSGLVSTNTFRLDSWWFDKALGNDRFTVRVGQFAAQDAYGDQLYGASFIFEPLQYGLGNLGAATYESFDPPSTPAAEIRVVPHPHFFVRSMVFAADRIPYAHNPTGLVPQFRGAASSASEIGFSPGKNASTVRPQDDIEARKGYSGLYRFGGVFNPGQFESIKSVAPVSGNYLIYGNANQAVYRTSRNGSHGLDLTANADWTPGDRTRNNQQLTVGGRFNEPLPIRLHNTIAVAYVRSGINQAFPMPSPHFDAHNAEHAFESNVLIELPHAVIVQPVLQYYVNTGGSSNSAIVFGLHGKIDF